MWSQEPELLNFYSFMSHSHLHIPYVKPNQMQEPKWYFFKDISIWILFNAVRLWIIKAVDLQSNSLPGQFIPHSVLNTIIGNKSNLNFSNWRERGNLNGSLIDMFKVEGSLWGTQRPLGLNKIDPISQTL